MFKTGPEFIRTHIDFSVFVFPGPSLPETLRLLAPLTSSVETLRIGGNRMGGAITPEITLFTKLTHLELHEMDLEGARVRTNFQQVPS